MTSLPLYRQARETAPQRQRRSAHAGLCFEKFADGWRRCDGRWEFDRGTPPSREDTGTWLRGFVEAKVVGDATRLDEACARQYDLIKALGGRMLRFKNTQRFVTGLGRQHPLENGATWHPTLGVPYLAGSSLKGLLRAFLRESTGHWNDEDKNPMKHRCEESAPVCSLFGQAGHVGRIRLLDMLPTRPLQLEVDVMTPHYDAYYQDGRIPGDWLSPNPIQFLAVAAGQSWQLGVLPMAGPSAPEVDELDDVLKQIVNALDWQGAGAKTAVGYGRFERDVRAEHRAHDQAVERAEAQRRQAEHERKLTEMPSEVAYLMKRALSEKWESDNNRFLAGVEDYLEDYPSPSPAAIDWLRQQFVKRWPPQGSFADIWNDPEAKKGKKKNQPVHKSKRAVEIVLRLKKLADREVPEA